MEKLPSIIHESWYPFLQPVFDNDFALKLFKAQILDKGNYYPEKKNIFRVFSMPLQDIKVVLLGQDPYVKEGQAIGYSFAVDQDCYMPMSLKVIAKEIENESLKSGFYDSDIPHWRTLEYWTEQGVFLLNAALTVEKGKSGTHYQFWSSFTKQVVKIIAKEVSPIWILWGKQAQSFIPFIKEADICNVILEAPHPAAEAYTNGHAGFYGCNHFVITNQILIKKNKSVVNW